MGDAHLDPGPVPPLKARALGVLLDARATFARHDAAWGWLGPWLLVSVVGVLSGVLYLARVDLDALLKAQNEAAYAQMDAATRKRLEEPEAAEGMEKFQRLQAFVAKLALIAGPPAFNLAGLLVAGGLLFGAARLGEARPELMRCVSLAAHAQLVNLVGLAATGLAVLTGNGHALTSPANLVGQVEHPVVFAALSRLDPVTVLYYVVIAAGLEASLRLPRRRAVALVAGAFVVLSALTVAAAAAGAALQSMGGAA